jgi:hypothetical protein
VRNWLSFPNKGLQMKDSSALILAGLFSQMLVLVFAVTSASLLPLIVFCLLGTALIVCGFGLLLSDN